MILKIKGKADRTAKAYKYICPIFRLDKTSLHQGLEKLSENRIHGYSIGVQRKSVLQPAIRASCR